MPWFLSYSDFGPESIHKLLQKAPFCSLPATIANHQVLFRGKNRRWGGGYPTLEPKKGIRVFGAAHLVTAEELDLIGRYYRDHYKTKIVQVTISATNDKFPATVFVYAGEDEISHPSDDLSKEIIKNLKFFWGQGNGKVPSLEDFGIMVDLAPKTVKVKK